MEIEINYTTEEERKQVFEVKGILPNLTLIIKNDGKSFKEQKPQALKDLFSLVKETFNEKGEMKGWIPYGNFEYSLDWELI